MISGKLIDKETNSSIENLVGEVYAMRTDGDGWRTTEIESNGTYSLILSPEIGYLIFTSNMMHKTESIQGVHPARSKYRLVMEL